MSLAIYVRVSTQRQAQTQTIEQQLDRLQTHVRNQGWALPVANIFRDDGYSGASLNRPGLDRLRDAVRAAEVDRVLITDPDRLARHYVHQMVLLEELERGGCQVLFLDRPISQDPHDHLLLQIRGAVAEYERTLIAERMRRGRQMKLRAGSLLPWTRPPYGYRVDPDHPRDPAGVRVEPAEAAVIQDLFARDDEPSASLFALALHLQAPGVLTPRGRRRWNPATIRGLLTNPAYTGQVYAGRTRARAPQVRRSATHPIGHPASSTTTLPPEEWIPVATVPALIGPEQFARVQAKLAQNRSWARRNNHAHDYLLRALVSCGVCQSSCLGRRSPPGYAYYLCRAKGHPLRTCRDERCPSRYLPAEALDALVWDDLCALLAHPESIAHALERARGGHWLPQDLQARRAQLRRGQVHLESQIERLTQAYLAAVIALPEYQRRRQELDQKIQALAAQAQQLDAQVDHHAELAGLTTAITAFCQRVRTGLTHATFEQKRTLVELLIDRVVVANDEVEIRYVIPTSPAGEHTRFCHLRKDYFNAPATRVIPPRRTIRRVIHRDEPGFGVPRLVQNPQVRRDAVMEQPDIAQIALGLARGEFAGGGQIAKARIDGQMPFQPQPVMPVRLRVQPLE
jgi:site-specific DNA recombinase